MVEWDTNYLTNGISLSGESSKYAQNRLVRKRETTSQVQNFLENATLLLKFNTSQISIDLFACLQHKQDACRTDGLGQGGGRAETTRPRGKDKTERHASHWANRSRS